MKQNIVPSNVMTIFMKKGPKVVSSNVMTIFVKKKDQKLFQVM